MEPGLTRRCISVRLDGEVWCSLLRACADDPGSPLHRKLSWSNSQLALETIGLELESRADCKQMNELWKRVEFVAHELVVVFGLRRAQLMCTTSGASCVLYTLVLQFASGLRNHREYQQKISEDYKASTEAQRVKLFVLTEAADHELRGLANNVLICNFM